MGLFTRKKAEAPEQVIDLRQPDESKPMWGSPSPCPSCQGRGYLDHIDPFREVMFIHCVECFHKYEVSRADVAADDPAQAFTV